MHSSEILLFRTCLSLVSTEVTDCGTPDIYHVVPRAHGKSDADRRRHMNMIMK